MKICPIAQLAHRQPSDDSIRGTLFLVSSTDIALSVDMAKVWRTPIYTLRSHSGKTVTIDVTTSVSASLPPNKVVAEKLVPLLKKRKIDTVLDFGGGALRHAIPLLDAGFEVCAVEFEESFKRAVCSEALTSCRKYPNFCALVWPSDFMKDNRKFGAALLCYVLQTMPLADERDTVIKYIYKKLLPDSYLLYMSRYNQMEGTDPDHRVRDGYYKWPDREHHSFYREFTTEETHAMFGEYGFKRLKSLSERGTDQVFLYGKGGSTWI